MPTLQEAGEGCHAWRSDRRGQAVHRDVGAQHADKDKCETWEAWAVEPRHVCGQAQASEGPIVPMKRGNSRRGTGPWFRVFSEEWTRGRLA